MDEEFDRAHYSLVSHDNKLPLSLLWTLTQYVTWSREMSHLSKMFNSHFLTPLSQSHNFEMLHFYANPLQLDIWLQSYEEFVNAKNNIKQRNWNTVFANISKPISPTSDSFLLIIIYITMIWNGAFIDFQWSFGKTNWQVFNTKHVSSQLVRDKNPFCVFEQRFHHGRMQYSIIPLRGLFKLADYWNWSTLYWIYDAHWKSIMFKLTKDRTTIWIGNYKLNQLLYVN